jgi:hypothetical protein
LTQATERPGARFLSWVADDEERVEQVLAFGREHGFAGSVARWTEGQLKAAHAYLLARRRPEPEVESVTTPDPESFGIRSGKDFYFWLRRQSADHGIALTDYIADWGRIRGYDRLIGNWDLHQVALGLAEANVKMAGAREIQMSLPSTPAAPVQVESVTTELPPPPPSAAARDLDWWRRNLKEHVLQVVALRYPGRKVTGPLIAEALALISQLDSQNRRLSNITFCDDPLLLAEFTALAAEQLVRLTVTQTPPLPLAAGEPTLFGPAGEDAA